MRLSFTLARGLAAGGVLLTGALLAADGLRFSQFTPLTASAPATADESQPITLANPAFEQRSIADRATVLATLAPNTGSWDMNTVNETGRQAGRYLFTVFETGQSGVQRHDLRNGTTDTIWFSPAPGAHVSFDASFWTPWGTYITAEESWETRVGGSTSPYGRLFELRNPVDAPRITTPLTATSNQGADFVHRNVIPRTSHEGIQFDDDGNMYFVDELNGGCLYKYTPAADFKRVLQGRADYFAAGQTFVLRVGAGTTADATGAYTWVPITDARGQGLPGSIVITDVNGVTSVDARNTTDLPAFKGTDYQRPEDLQIQRRRGRDYLYVATTTNHQVFRLDLRAQTIALFADRSTLDLATGAAVGAAFTNPDNLAVDHQGNLYIVEDRNGGVDDDIWFARDLNQDGDLTDAGEGLARWASNGTPGSEFTGLYFDPFHPRRAWVNIQHPASGVDRTMQITLPGADDDDDCDERDGHHGRRGGDEGDDRRGDEHRGDGPRGQR